VSDDRRPVLYLVGFAAPPVLHINGLVSAAQQRGWDPCLILTPTAARWVDAELHGLAAATEHPIRTSYKLPSEPDELPPPDAILAAPVTFNSINKWAAGISDTLALGLVTEAIGKGLRITAVPSLNHDQEKHPAYRASVRILRDAGVTVLLDPQEHPVRRTDEADRSTYPWDLALETLQPHRSIVND
jgi:hypothetical protein